MSRVGQKPISLTKDTQIKLEGSTITVVGPKGQLSYTFRPEVTVTQQDDAVKVDVRDNSKFTNSLHGLTRTLIANMVHGVSEGWQKTLELVGVGYRAQKQGDNLLLSVGYSHPVVIEPPAGIQFAIVEGKIVVSGIDKSQVGQVAATIRQVREPEPYKGKGIRYAGEIVKIKPGKAAKAGLAQGK
ncbi:50S ribosomal protein L6 [Candidatus Daviesbacteria bacterium]|nr:50S ribosomal protein L6 [Candidatus Daviesbacteria bacterium]